MITIAQASKMAGKSPATIRRWVDKGYIRFEKTTKGRTVDPEDLKRYLSCKAHESVITPITNETVSKPNEHDSYHETILNLKEHIADLRNENREIREQNKNLHSEIFKLTHEIKSILSASEKKNILSRWIKTLTT